MAYRWPTVSVVLGRYPLFKLFEATGARMDFVGVQHTAAPSLSSRANALKYKALKGVKKMAVQAVGGKYARLNSASYMKEMEESLTKIIKPYRSWHVRYEKNDNTDTAKVSISNGPLCIDVEVHQVKNNFAQTLILKDGDKFIETKTVTTAPNSLNFNAIRDAITDSILKLDPGSARKMQ